ncbi:MAG TPA: caspase family protein, partial [Arcobacter sp.]|nr:caspase family protein [Arcobacter sp.]
VLFTFILLYLLLGCSLNKISDLDDSKIVIKPLKRVALVIGNKNYPYKPLDNPINDAKKVKEVLEGLDFEVIYDEDISAKQFTNLLEEFKSKLDKNTIAFFYFSGHANTLVPSSIESFLLMFEERQETLVSIYKLYQYLNEAKSRANIICLDACRDYNQSSRKGNNKGLTRGERVTILENKKLKVKLEPHKLMNAPRNTLTVYATDFNQVAKDASTIDPQYSPFTRAFIQHIGDEGVSFLEVLKRIGKEMDRDMNGSQISSENGRLDRYIYLNPTKANRPMTAGF